MIKVYKDGRLQASYITKKKACEALGVSPYTLNIHISSGENINGFQIQDDNIPNKVMIFYKGNLVNIVKSVQDAEKETGIKVYRIRNLINVGDEYHDYSFDYA